jgi:ribulose 1,5-bisphosphate synthetase/thiazole synthase
MGTQVLDTQVLDTQVLDTQVLDTQVLIVGAGPVGLTLAVDLGRRGVRCMLIEKNAAPLG